MLRNRGKRFSNRSTLRPTYQEVPFLNSAIVLLLRRTN